MHDTFRFYALFAGEDKNPKIGIELNKVTIAGYNILALCGYFQINRRIDYMISHSTSVRDHVINSLFF